jgi:hypothetical protein
MQVRSTIQQIFAEHKRRYGYRRMQPKAFVITTDSGHELEAISTWRAE